MRLFLLIVGLLGSLTINAQIASTSQFGVIKIGSGAVVDANGFLNVTATGTGTASTTTVQTLRDSWPVNDLYNPTAAQLQTAIDNAPGTGSHIRLNYTNTTLSGGNLTINNKPNLWLDARSLYHIVRTDGTAMLAILGNCTNSRVSGFSFITTSSNASGTVVSSYETAKLDNFQFDNNYVSCPYADVNAFGIVQYSPSNVGNSQRSTNVDVSYNKFIGIGRMAAEILAQASGDSTVAAYLTNVTFRNNVCKDLGRVNTDGHGMAISVDGLVDNLLIEYNDIAEAKNKSIEVVNTRNSIVRKNKVRNYVNQDVTGVAQSAGNSPFTYGLTVEDNDVETTGSSYIYFDLHRLFMYRNRGINTLAGNPSANRGMYFVRVTRGDIQSNEIRSAGFQGAMLNDSRNVYLTGNTITNEFNPRQLQVVYFYGSNSSGNVLVRNYLAKMPGAYRSDLPYVNEGGGASGNTFANNDIVTAGPIRQPYFADGTNGIVLLLNGQSTNPFDIVDESVQSKVVLKNGNPIISTAQFKYGSSSIFFDGNSSLIIPASKDFDFGTGDFTFEAWIYPTATPTGYPGLVSRQTAANVSWTWGLSLNSSALDFNVVNNANNYTNPGPSASGSMSLNTWHHVAIVTTAGTRKQYMDGVQVASTTNVPSMELNTVGQNLVVGAQGDGDASNGTFFRGYMHLRLTKGLARYTAGFTPPTSF